ncbi:hypothetical protein BHE74_00058623 [Ensete ventricosum]|nr:hypothetical protein BHE74_00058623 [Ensete ventricosum]
MDLPAKGTSLGTPKLQAVKPVDSVETHFADSGPDSYRKCLREELTLFSNQHLGPTWQAPSPAFLPREETERLPARGERSRRPVCTVRTTRY